MAFGRDDREHARSSALPDWMRSFADSELEREAKGGSPFDEIKGIFSLNKGLGEVEKRVSELRDRIGLDKIKGASQEGEGMRKQAFDPPEIGMGKVVRELLSAAARLEANGYAKASAAAERLVSRMRRTAEETSQKSIPQVLKDNPKLKTFIDNVCRSRGGHVSVEAVMKMIRDERPERMAASDELRNYVKSKNQEEWQDVNDGGDGMAGQGVGTQVTKEEETEGYRMFEEPDRG